MLRSAASKALGLGRATMLPVVLAVMLVVLFGTTPASAHKGYKGLLHLGHKSVIANATTLVGNVATGSALVVNNPSGGSALGLQVNARQAPLTVNADAGTATNFDADKLDGKTSSEFAAAAHNHDSRYYSKTESDGRYLGKAEKAADSDKLDGIDSTALLPGGSLPNGRTVRGSYDIRDYVTPAWQGTTLGVETSAISFGYRLSSTPAVRIIKAGATPPAQCPGTTAWPQAAPGYLCVYEHRGSSNMSSHPFAYNVTRNGASLYAHLSNNSNTNVDYYTYGTWAVTGN